MRTDIKNNISPASSLRAATYAGASNGTGIDLAGFDAACAIIDAGALHDPDNVITFQLQDSDDNVNFVVVAAGFLDGAQPVVNAANQLVKVGYHGTKRYLRVAITAVAGTAPTVIASATIVRAKGRLRPS